MKNVKLLLSLLGICFLFLNTNAQLTLDKDSNSNLIKLNGLTYELNGVRKPCGVFHKNIKKELEISPNAIIEFKKFERNRKIAFAVYAGSLASMIVVSQIEKEPSKRLFNLRIVGLASIFIIVPILSKSQKHLHKAIGYRNYDVKQFGGDF